MIDWSNYGIEASSMNDIKGMLADFSRRNKEEYESDFTPVFFTVPTKEVADFVEVEEFHNEELSEPYFFRMVNMLKKHYPDYDFSSLSMEFYIHINADDPAYSVVIFA
jgi:hypothetical protein|nr:MAG TPA: repressor of RNA polymerase III [Bacteriophage sp.]